MASFIAFMLTGLEGVWTRPLSFLEDCLGFFIFIPFTFKKLGLKAVHFKLTAVEGLRLFKKANKKAPVSRGLKVII